MRYICSKRREEVTQPNAAEIQKTWLRWKPRSPFCILLRLYLSVIIVLVYLHICVYIILPYNDAGCRLEVKFVVLMAKAASKKPMTLFTSKLDLNL